MIFDCFTFFNELDLLDARLHELDGAVDVFVLVEARQTFQGAPKPLYFELNQARYAKFLPRIVHIVVDFPADVKHLYPKAASEAWAREYYQRDQIARGLDKAAPDDLVIVSDVDEIVCRQRLETCVATRRSDEVSVFAMSAFTGAANRKVKDFVWNNGPRMLRRRDFTSAQNVRTLALIGSKTLHRLGAGPGYTRFKNWRRTGIGNPVRAIDDSGWHFSAIGDWTHYREKLSSYAHEEHKARKDYSNAEFYDGEIRQMTDVVDLAQLPEFIRDHPERFKIDAKR